MVRIAAFITGLFLVVISVLGFMPEFNQGGKFLGVFAINSISNILHLATGIIAMLCGLRSSRAAACFFITIGVFYGVLAILAVYDSTMTLFQFIATDGANNIFHAIIAAVSLYFGFAYLHKK